MADIEFEGKTRRMAKIDCCLKKHGIKNLEEARSMCFENQIDVSGIVKSVQPIAFENAVWAYTLGCAVALKKSKKNAAVRAALRNNPEKTRDIAAKF